MTIKLEREVDLSSEESGKEPKVECKAKREFETWTNDRSDSFIALVLFSTAVANLISCFSRMRGLSNFFAHCKSMGLATER